MFDIVGPINKLRPRNYTHTDHSTSPQCSWEGNFIKNNYPNSAPLGFQDANDQNADLPKLILLNQMKGSEPFLKKDKKQHGGQKQGIKKCSKRFWSGNVVKGYFDIQSN